MNKKILVTGGAGYIGSIVSHQLISAGYSIIVLDNLSKGHREAVPKDAVFLNGDIADERFIGNVFSKYDVDAVMHFAAFIEAGESMKVPEKYFHNNTINTLLFLEQMIKSGVRKFVFSSTAAVYGNPKTIPIEEDAPLIPTNAYGSSKLLVEKTLEWYENIHGLHYAALRYFNASGATNTNGEDHSPETHLIPRAIAAALGTGSQLELFGTDYETKDGTCVRDYIHVSDLSSAHILALEALGKKENSKLIYNLGSQQGFTNKEVIAAVSSVTKKKVPFVNSPRRAGDPAVLIASSEKIKKELNWQPKYKDIESIIESAYQWRLTHPEGYLK